MRSNPPVTLLLVRLARTVHKEDEEKILKKFILSPLVQEENHPACMAQTKDNSVDMGAEGEKHPPS